MKILTTAFLLAVTVSGYAESKQYLEMRTDCESRLYDYYQSRLINPSKDSAIKQKVQESQLKEKALLNMKKEWLLGEYFNVEIKQHQIEREFDRIINSTKDFPGLKQLFNALDNDKELITQCIVRPLVVEKIFVHKYATDTKIHLETKQLALKGIESNDFKSATKYTVTDKATHTKNELLNTLYYFTYRNNNIVYQWQKKPAEKWINKMTPSSNNIQLPTIKPVKMSGFKVKTNKSSNSDYWEHSEIMPKVRIGHTAIWTGNEMIVWGGVADNGAIKTGGRYDPVTDTWYGMTTNEAPLQRAYHTAIWTGSEMIIWGGNYIDGNSYGQPVKSGAKYNPYTNKWIPIEEPGSMIKSRAHHTAIWTGTTMIIYGGKGIGYSQNGLSGGIYYPASDSWEYLPGAPRYNHTAVWTGNEMIIWGGQDDTGYISAGTKYNPNNPNDGWADISTTGPQPRANHTAVWTGAEMIVWGGNDDVGRTKSGARYNPVTDQWTPTNIPAAPPARSNHTAIWDGSEMIVWGGTQTSGLAQFGGRYNPDTDTWDGTTSNNRPTYRQNHTAVWTGNEMIIWGGENNNGYLSDGAKYNPDTNSWQSTRYFQRQTVKRDHTAIWTGNEMITWGGVNVDTHEKTNGGYKYNPTINSFIPISTVNAPSPRQGHIAVWTGNTMLISGGDNDTGGQYNPATDSWTSIPLQNRHRSNAEAVWTGSELFVFGGTFSGDSRAEIFNPQQNSWRDTSLPPTQLPTLGMSVVWTGDEVIVWGGLVYSNTSGPSNEGAKYDLLTGSWAMINTSLAPSKRTYHSAAWTGTDMIVGGGQYFGTSGGIYDPMTDSWSGINNTSAPLRANNQTGVWTGSELIVWGGSEASSNQILNSGARLGKNGNWTPTTTINAPNKRDRHTAVWTGTGMIVAGGKEGVSIYYPKNPDVIFANGFE
jgi:N-acetylneuraminic acid mutarotase